MAENEAAADVTLDQLLFDGQKLDANVTEAISSATLRRTIDGAPTLTLGIEDPKRELLRSGIFDDRITAQLDGKSFELAKVSKGGNVLSTVFEDLVIAELRRHDEPRKVEAGTMTRLQFARLLLSETPWIPLIVNPIAKAEVTNVELARGTVASESQQEDKEDTWTCLKRVFAEIGWRCYVDNGGVNVGPDSAYLDRGSVMKLKEHENGVDDIDFDWDVGKPVATARLPIRAHRWQAPPGTPVEVVDLGPASGLWLVSEIERELSTVTASVTLKRGEPELPEPAAPQGEADDGGSTGKGTTAKNIGSFARPVAGTITSPFGDNRGHKGIDIAAKTGTPIVAARAGTVTFAGQASGYGNVVYIDHGNGVQTRYAHMSKITTRRGVQVSAGTKLGEVGATGDATGPHLHYEVRINGTAINPAQYI